MALAVVFGLVMGVAAGQFGPLDALKKAGCRHIFTDTANATGGNISLKSL